MAAVRKLTKENESKSRNLSTTRRQHTKHSSPVNTSHLFTHISIDNHLLPTCFRFHSFVLYSLWIRHKKYVYSSIYIYIKQWTLVTSQSRNRSHQMMKINISQLAHRHKHNRDSTSHTHTHNKNNYISIVPKSRLLCSENRLLPLLIPPTNPIIPHRVKNGGVY